MKTNEIMQNQSNILLTLGVICKIIAQVICLIVYGYYMIQASNYEVTWSLLNRILPTKLILFLNNTLSNIGTLILMIPSAIIIANWLMPKERILGILSSLRCGLGIIVIIYTLVKTGSFIPENIKLKLVKVAYILSLEEKKIMFITQWSDLIHDKNIIVEKYMVG